MKTVLVSALLFLSVAVSAQQADDMVLLGSWDDPTLPRYNDVWGYAAGGREYALLGSAPFVHILDVTDPANITEVARLNNFAGSTSIWRDIKTYDQYAYCVTEAREGLQIVDLSNLPTSAGVVHVDTFGFFTCHNIFIDSLATPAKLYAFGTDSENQGFLVYSLADPSQPQLLSSTSLISLGRYIHDGFVIRDTLFANHGFAGMYVYDVSSPATPVELGRLTNYPESGYNHSCWRTETTDYLVLCDETSDRGVKVIDVADPFDMQVESVFRSALLDPAGDGTGPRNSLAHNPYVMGDSVVVLSYYGDGVQVWDIRDPTAPFRVGYYDTTPTGTGYGGGVWGAYPWLPSGNILGSDINNGLFVLGRQQLISLPVSYASWTVHGDGKNALLQWTTAAEQDNAGFGVQHSQDGINYQEIGFVAPSNSRDYSFVHAEPGNGINYYRLRQVDIDGSESYSEIRRIEFTSNQEALRIFPNPTATGAELTLTGFPESASWTLHDLNGRKLSEGTGPRLRVEAAGVYLLRAGREVRRVVVY